MRCPGDEVGTLILKDAVIGFDTHLNARAGSHFPLE
jgi:hypothetical protein